MFHWLRKAKKKNRKSTYWEKYIKIIFFMKLVSRVTCNFYKVMIIFTKYDSNF